MSSKYETKDIILDDSLKKSYNYKPIEALNGCNSSTGAIPKQSNGQVSQRPVEVRGGGKS